MDLERIIKYGLITIALVISMLYYVSYQKIQPIDHKQTLIVYSCGGSTDMLNEVDEKFEKKYGCKVRLISSNTVEYLKLITHNCSGDLVVSRSIGTPDYLENLGLVNNYSIVYFTTWDIAVRKGNPKHISSLSDLLKPDVSVLTASKASISEYGIFNENYWHIVSELYAKSDKDFNCRRVMLYYFLSGHGDACIVESRLIHSLNASNELTAIPISRKYYDLQSSVFTASILKNSKNKNLARQYIEFLLTNNDTLNIMKKYGYIPANSKYGKYITERYYAKFEI